MNSELIYTAKIEQTYDYPKRMKYVAESDSFIEQAVPSLSYERNFKQPYGWLKESGTPPNEHLDVIIMTDAHFELGDELAVRVIGVFVRGDGDNKFVAVPLNRKETDLMELSPSEIEDLNRLYKKFSQDEGWLGKKRAMELIEEYENKPRRKIIFTVQHCESEHHVNGHVGAWGNWNLTENGKQQAVQIGKFLEKCEGCKYSFKIFTSDLNRALQTAEGINSVLGIPEESFVKSELIREINLGQGNGKSRDWYNKNVKPWPAVYNPEFRSFPDAECDREFWARLKKFYDQIISSKDERIIIVSHGGALTFLNAMIMGDSFEDTQKRKFYGHSGGVTKLVIQPDGIVEVPYMNLWV